jgi:hypothetical protein
MAVTGTTLTRATHDARVRARRRSGPAGARPEREIVEGGEPERDDDQRELDVEAR